MHSYRQIDILLDKLTDRHADHRQTNKHIDRPKIDYYKTYLYNHMRLTYAVNKIIKILYIQLFSSEATL